MTYGMYEYMSVMRAGRPIKIARVREREQVMEDMEKFRCA